MSPQHSRRNFLTIIATMASLLACNAGSKQPIASTSDKRQTISVSDTLPDKPMPERVLGKTGISLPIFGLGCAGQTPLYRTEQEAEAIALVEAAIAMGIRYFDTAASYGPSEGFLGKVLPQYRDNIFLASKTARRDRDGAWRQLEQSLNRLNTDHLDLWQLHHVGFTEDLDNIFASDGAIKAFEEAKAQKIIRYVGITGHHEPSVIIEGLRRYPFDTTLISINAADIHHPRPFSTNVLPVAQEQNVGVIAMKVPAYGRLFEPGRLSGMEQAMGYTLSLPGVHSCIIAAESIRQLQANIKTARLYTALEAAEMKQIEQQVADIWQEVSFYRKWA